MESRWLSSKRIMAAYRALWGGCVVLVLAANANIALAQLPTASILGTVRDSSGAVIPGAEIAAKNTETGLMRSAVSGEDGSYRFPALPVGNYEVRAELAFRR